MANIKYLKDEQGNKISPVVSVDSIVTSGGGKLIDYIYPIGSIYMSINSTNPSTLFGGTWQQLKDRFLLGVGDTYKTVSATGGETSVTLTVDEMPKHHHDVYIKANQIGALGDVVWVEQYDANHTTVGCTETGGNKPHNNMPPYLTVYMWKRTK